MGSKAGAAAAPSLPSMSCHRESWLPARAPVAWELWVHLRRMPGPGSRCRAEQGNKLCRPAAGVSKPFDTSGPSDLTRIALEADGQPATNLAVDDVLHKVYIKVCVYLCVCGAAWRIIPQ